MPEFGAYKHGFGLHKGLKLANYKLTDINLKYKTIKPRQTYIYPIQLTFEPKDNANVRRLMKELKLLVGKARIIYTQYDYPYRCQFGRLYKDVAADGTVIVSAVGVCDRIAFD
jgi:hypothetical protein